MNSPSTRFFDSSAHPYNVISLGTSLEYPEKLHTPLPYLRECLKSLKLLCDYGSDRALRPYMSQLLTQNYFELVSPLSGQATRSGSSLLLNSKSVTYCFPNEPNLMVCATNLGSGFPLSSLILRSLGLILHINEPVWGIEPKHLDHLDQIILDTEWQISPADSLPEVILGDPNFAHYAWNQFGAIRSALALKTQFKIVCTNDPLGYLEDLLPDISPDQIQRTPTHALHKINGPRKVFIPLGSTLITLESRDIILSQALKNLSAEAKAILNKITKKDQPVLWVSIRTRNRTATNLKEALVALCEKFLDTVPDGLVIIDGHSTPFDFLTNPNTYNIPEVNEIISYDRALGKEIVEALPFKERVHLAIGLPISCSLVLAQKATFYFTHHGTVQHKIGWFTSCPGVVHSNRITLGISPARWVAEQSIIATIPVYIPEDLVMNSTSSDEDAISKSLMRDNYTITKIGDLVNFVENLWSDSKSYQKSIASLKKKRKFTLNRLLKNLKRIFNLCSK